MSEDKGLDERIIFENGNDLGFFAEKQKYEINDILFIRVEREWELFKIYSIPETNASEQLYYARKLR